MNAEVLRVIQLELDATRIAVTVAIGRIIALCDDPQKESEYLLRLAEETADLGVPRPNNSEPGVLYREHLKAKLALLFASASRQEPPPQSGEHLPE